MDKKFITKLFGSYDEYGFSSGVQNLSLRKTIWLSEKHLCKYCAFKGGQDNKRKNRKRELKSWKNYRKNQYK